MNLREAEEGKTYTVKNVNTDDEELRTFLFTLGCCKGEPITVILNRKNFCVVSVKDCRYSIDPVLAKVVEIK